MGLLYKREKRAFVGYAFKGFLLLALVALVVKFWFITVPLLILFGELLIVAWSRKRARTNPRP